MSMEKKKVEVVTEIAEDPQGFPRKVETLYIDGESVMMPEDDLGGITYFVLDHLGYEVELIRRDTTEEDWKDWPDSWKNREL